MLKLRRKAVIDLKARLAEVEREIAAHPLASEAVTRAHAIIDSDGKGDPAELQRQLAAHGLPSPEELGRIQLAGTASWWSLHRQKRKLEAKIARRSAR